MAEQFSSSSALKYHFNVNGIVEQVFFNKAILGFKLNSGSKESAILLSKMLHIDGKPLEEKQTMSDYLKVNDVVFFDCHIYDKGGVGSGKDRCNYFAMKAWKNEALAGGQYKLPLASNTRYSTGWLSEIYPRSGVITFISNTDERVSFSAAKMYLYEKRLGSRQSLTTLLNLGDQVFFEAVPNDNCGSHSDYCSWQANLVWKGKRPQVDPNNLESLPTLSRKDSLDSSSSSDLNTEDSCSNSGSFLILPTSGKLHGIVKGTGMVAKIVSANAGVIWWVRRSNHFESVWFEGCKLFKYGENLANKKLSECIREGDAVNFVAEKAPPDSATKWHAKQVLITEDAASDLDRILKNNQEHSC